VNRRFGVRVGGDEGRTKTGDTGAGEEAGLVLPREWLAGKPRVTAGRTSALGNGYGIGKVRRVEEGRTRVPAPLWSCLSR